MQSRPFPRPIRLDLTNSCDGDAREARPVEAAHAAGVTAAAPKRLTVSTANRKPTRTKSRAGFRRKTLQRDRRGMTVGKFALRSDENALSNGARVRLRMLLQKHR